MMKIIAYYLPQYHEITENNMWWGKGFTEWTNVKKAKPLYKTHIQPKIPLNNNYYDLTNKETLKWQIELAKKYKVDIFCFYHYWFEGKLLLEKPAELLLNDENLQQEFFFCWANHSWKKTWNGLNEILMKQEYGDEDKWELHFNYLKKFFVDERYLKIDNRPVFMIFNPKDIEQLDKMINYFDKKCKELNFSGIYIIESVNSIKSIEKVSKLSKGQTLREPLCGLEYRNIFEKILHKLKSKFKKNYLYFIPKYDYKKIMKYSLKISKRYVTSNTYPGVFTEWDNTPRHHRRGYVIKNESKEDFKTYLLEQKKIMKNKKCEYIFINAWNEWAEGMYLEPDEKNGYKYLEIIKEVVETEV